MIVYIEGLPKEQGAGFCREPKTSETFVRDGLDVIEDSHCTRWMQSLGLSPFTTCFETFGDVYDGLHRVAKANSGVIAWIGDHGEWLIKTDNCCLR